MSILSFRHNLSAGLHLTALLVGCATAPARAQLAPPPDQPLLAIPQTWSAPVIDGRLEAAEWADAAQITGFVGHNQAGLFPLPTTVLLKWDETALYVGFRSQRTGRPLVANARQGGTVWLDDGMELMLAPGRDGSGGFFHWIGNTQSAFYDENQQADSAWESRCAYAAQVSGKDWTAEWQLPWSGLGAGARAPVPEALWRFLAADNRTSESGSTWELRSEWNNPGAMWSSVDAWGWLRFTRDTNTVAVIDTLAVVPGPELLFRGHSRHGPARCELRILRDGQTVEKRELRLPADGQTAELKWTPATRGVADLVAEITDASGTVCWRQVVKNQSFSGKLRLELLPDAFQRKLLVRAEPVPDCPAASLQATLTRSDGVVLGSFPLLQHPPTGSWAVDVDADLFHPGGVTARVEARDTAGATLATEEAFVSTHPLPEWAAAPAGLETTVPAPWPGLSVLPASTQAQPPVVQCWNRDYKFAGSGPDLVAQITSSGLPLLAGPVRLRVLSSGQELAWQDAAPPLWRSAPDGFVLERRLTAGRIGVTVTLRLAYDGYLQLSTVFSPAQPLALDRVWLEIPLTPGRARFFQYGAEFLSQAGALPPDGIRAPSNRLWLGSRQAGLGVQRFPEANAILPAMQADTPRQGRATVLTCDLLAAPRLLEGACALDVGLVATPVKPWQAQDDLPQSYQPISYADADHPERLDQLVAAGVKILVFHEHWTPFESSGVPYDAAKLKKLVAETHQRGMKIVLYIGFQVADQWPEFSFYRRPWCGVGKLDGAYPRVGLPGRGISQCFSISPITAPAWVDYITWTVASLMREYDIDGIFKDGGFSECRPLAERLYRVIKAAKPEGILCAHGDSFAAATGAFCTDSFGGEGLANELRNRKLRVIPQDFLQALDGRNFGMPIGGWAMNHVVQGVMDWERAAANYLTSGWYFLGTEMPSLQFLTPLWRQEDLFRHGERFLEGEPGCPLTRRGGGADIRFSVWTKGGRMLIALGNLGENPADVTLTAPSPGRWQRLAAEGEVTLGTSAEAALECPPGCLRLLWFEGPPQPTAASGSPAQAKEP